jgi:hypothetical protein
MSERERVCSMHMMWYCFFLFKKNKGLRCNSMAESGVPPGQAGKPREAILFEDVDVRDCPWGNITVSIKVQASNGGRFRV